MNPNATWLVLSVPLIAMLGKSCVRALLASARYSRIRATAPCTVRFCTSAVCTSRSSVVSCRISSHATPAVVS